MSFKLIIACYLDYPVKGQDRNWFGVIPELVSILYLADRKSLMSSNHKYLRLSVVLLPALVFTASLTQKAFSYQYIQVEVTDGLLLLLMGGIAWIGGGLLETLVWMANPIALIALIRFFRESSSLVKIEPVLKTVIPNPRPRSYWISAIAAAIAWSFSLWNEVLAAESGSMGEILSLEPGYWLWVSSFTLLAIGINYFRFRVRNA